MKANTKKLLAMGLSVVLAVGCLTGCGGDSKSSSTSGDTAKTGDEGGSSSSKKTFDDLGGMSIKIGRSGRGKKAKGFSPISTISALQASLQQYR